MSGLEEGFSFQDAYTRRRLSLGWWLEQCKDMTILVFSKLREQVFLMAETLTRNSTSGYVRTGQNLYMAVAMHSLDLGCRNHSMDFWERTEAVRIAETLAGLLFDATGSHESSLEMRKSWTMWREHCRRSRIALV